MEKQQKILKLQTHSPVFFMKCTADFNIKNSSYYLHVFEEQMFKSMVSLVVKYKLNLYILDSMTTLAQRWQTVGPLANSWRWVHNVRPTLGQH